MTAAGPLPAVLASGSTIRRSLLAAAGVDVTVAGHGIDERALIGPLLAAGAAPPAVASALAEAKAVAGSSAHRGAVVIGADQTLELDGRLFTKAADRSAARARLVELSGRTHALHAAWALARDGAVLAAGLSTASLTMRPLGDAELDWYVDAAGDGLTESVGAYQLEGLGARLFERYEGDYFAVLGLPLLDVLAALRSTGALLP